MPKGIGFSIEPEGKKKVEKTTQEAKDRKDAERYRYLRECHWEGKGLAVVMDATTLKLGTQCLSEGLLDEHLDVLLELEGGR